MTAVQDEKNACKNIFVVFKYDQIEITMLFTFHSFRGIPLLSLLCPLKFIVFTKKGKFFGIFKLLLLTAICLDKIYCYCSKLSSMAFLLYFVKER